MQRTHAVQVVLGEGEPGILRLILEAQGFHVVGHARGDDELRQIVAITHPSVIVLDAGISAAAAHEAQIRSDYTPIVVVWPKDAFTPLAEERVDPGTAFLELGNAVRRVIERHAEPIRVPESEEEVEPLEAVATRRPRRRARHALVVVAAWTIALTALAAIGLAVPSALRGLGPTGTRHPVLDRPDRALTTDRERPAGSDTRSLDGTSCADTAPGRSGRHPSHGKPDHPGNACGQAHGTHAASGNGNGKGKRNDHGRPEDPGSRGSGGPPSEKPSKSEKDKGGHRHADGDGGTGSDGGGDGSPKARDRDATSDAQPND